MSLPIALERVPSDAKIKPVVPVKRINDEGDVQAFAGSPAWQDITTFIRQLNYAMVPRQDVVSRHDPRDLRGSQVGACSRQVAQISGIVTELDQLVESTPPHPGPRRYGNFAFREWHDKVVNILPDLLDRNLPDVIWSHVSTLDRSVLREELAVYLIGGLGHAQRLDYGTGHELSFVAFLACLWKLGGFADSADGDEERDIVMSILVPYIKLIRKLILTYTLEPAGSHGVWGLDDHFFVSYILGSAQLAPPIRPGEGVPIVGSLSNAPDTADVTKEGDVRRLAGTNLYFDAIKFIYDVKRGPFWEHSPTLYNISGIKEGWAKINKGLLKMYDAEVLGKFPVVQHFLFGSLFIWDHDLSKGGAATDCHESAAQNCSDPQTVAVPVDVASAAVKSMPMQPPATRMVTTSAPWARKDNEATTMHASTSTIGGRPNPSQSARNLQTIRAGNIR